MLVWFRTPLFSIKKCVDDSVILLRVDGFDGFGPCQDHETIPKSPDIAVR